MCQTFTEKTRVQIPAILHLSRLGYTFRKKESINWDPDTNILIDVFNEAIRKINPRVKDTELNSLYEDIKVSINNDDLGESFLKMLQRRSGIKLIDFFNIENNDFSCTYEMPFIKDNNDFRPDVTVYINGIPLAFIEVKVPNNKDGIEAERKRMNDRLSNRAYKHFFNELQLLIFSNNMEYDVNPDALVPISGAFYCTRQSKNFKFMPFRESDNSLIEKYRKIEYSFQCERELLSEANAYSSKDTEEYKINIDGNRPTNRIITSLLSKERFIYLLNYGLCYLKEINEDTGMMETTKHIMRYPQLLGSLTLIDKLNQGLKKGIFWHTQGSGKTELAFYLVKILTDYFGLKNASARFLFIPDRMDLFVQACSAFSGRGLKVQTVNNRAEFKNAISSSSNILNNEGTLEMMVVNTQKISEEAQVTASTHYSTNNQTVIFVDECHRSYDSNGTFLANLLNIDKNAIIIGLTGTPLIMGKDINKSKALFGNYIHSYYYNQSIADGYTLKLMREEILKTFNEQLNDIKNKMVQKGVTNLDEIFSSKEYVEPAVDYIVNDFEDFQLIHDYDTPNKKTGAMIVCYSNPQAEKIHEYLKKLGKTSALITYKTESKEKDDLIDKYKKTNEIDYLVVENMLLTGFNCDRLKKMYLLRKMHAHNLLQGLTRVNRPFKNFKYGYIVDFEGIMGEFQKTNDAYMEELNNTYGDDVIKQIDIFVDQNEILNRAQKIDECLFSFDTSNLENFTNQINNISNYEDLKQLKKVLDEAKDLYGVARISNNIKFYTLDIKTIKSMSREVDRRYEIIRLQELLKNSSQENSALLFQALQSIEFKFIKVREHELVLADKWRESIKRLGNEFERNTDKKDPIYITLYDELKSIMSKHDIEQVDDSVLKEIELLTQQISNLNASNNRIAEKYNNDYKFVRIHKRLKELLNSISDVKLHKTLVNIKEYLDSIVDKNSSIINNEAYFERMIQVEVDKQFEENEYELTIDELKQIDILIYQEYYNSYMGVYL